MSGELRRLSELVRNELTDDIGSSIADAVKDKESRANGVIVELRVNLRMPGGGRKFGFRKATFILWPDLLDEAAIDCEE